MNRDIGQEIIDKLTELNSKLDKLSGGKDEKESSDTSLS